MFPVYSLQTLLKDLIPDIAHLLAMAVQLYSFVSLLADGGGGFTIFYKGQR